MVTTVRGSLVIWKTSLAWLPQLEGRKRKTVQSQAEHLWTTIPVGKQRDGFVVLFRYQLRGLVLAYFKGRCRTQQLISRDPVEVLLACLSDQHVISCDLSCICFQTA